MESIYAILGIIAVILLFAMFRLGDIVDELRKMNEWKEVKS